MLLPMKKAAPQKTQASKAPPKRSNQTKRVTVDPLKLLAERVNICVGPPVIEHLQFAFRLLRNVTAHFDVLLGREQIPAGFQFRAAICRVRGNH